jgi:hypothetical protein
VNEDELLQDILYRVQPMYASNICREPAKYPYMALPQAEISPLEEIDPATRFAYAANSSITKYSEQSSCEYKGQSASGTSMRKEEFKAHVKRAPRGHCPACGSLVHWAKHCAGNANPNLLPPAVPSQPDSACKPHWKNGNPSPNHSMSRAKFACLDANTATSSGFDDSVRDDSCEAFLAMITYDIVCDTSSGTSRTVLIFFIVTSPLYQGALIGGEIKEFCDIVMESDVDGVTSCVII